MITQRDLDEMLRMHTVALTKDGKYGEFVELFQGDLSCRNFVDVRMVGAIFRRCQLRDCYFDGVDFSQANLTGCDFTGSKFRDVIFDHTILCNAKFNKCEFVRCSFERIKLGVMDYRAIKKIPGYSGRGAHKKSQA